MIKWCKCIKYYNTEDILSSLPLKPGHYFECFVGEKFRYKKIGKKNYFIDIIHPYIDYSDAPNRDEGWPVHDEYFNKHFIDVTIEIRQQKIDYVLN